MVLRQVTDAAAEWNGCVILAEKAGVTGSGVDNAEKDLDEGRLSRPVGAEQAKYFSLADRQRYVDKGLDLPFSEDSGSVGLAEIGDFDMIHGER